jgi:DNA-directed RNA polymerase subunit RPC12/RpoP
MTFLQKMKEGFIRFMQGRHGNDNLGMVTLFAGLILSLVGAFGGGIVFTILGLTLYIITIFRMFSRNIAARQREAAAYTRLTKFFTDRQNRYYACPSCGQTVRVPRGKGRISIKCPRCGQRFEKKT